MKLRVTVAGDKKLAARLARMSGEMAGQKMETAVVSGALLVQNRAKEIIKEKKVYKTGNLRRSIHIGGHAEQSELANSDGTDIGGNSHTKTKAEVLVGTNVVYAASHEYGRGNLAARPYLRPALDESKGDVAREIGDALKQLLRSV